jgi:hypothetical protein
MAKLNRDWHRAHPMAKNATERQRAEWHYEHANHCGCREVTPTIAALLAANGFKLPKTTNSAPSANGDIAYYTGDVGT